MLSFSTYWKKQALITKRLSPIVYHMTSIPNLARILDSNKLFLSVAACTKSELELNKGKLYYFSTARSLASDYFHSSGAGAYLVLDNTVMNANYKGVPVDYWGRGSAFNKPELEDRIVSDKPEIPNAAKYIQEIHIAVPEGIFAPDKDTSRAENAKKSIKRISFFTKKLNIPLYLYKNEKDLLTKNKQKAIPLPLDQLKALKQEPVHSWDERAGKRFSHWLELTHLHTHHKQDKAFGLRSLYSR